ncbi:hypothetical protein Nepgr_013268 [Nepenthes gracilis]|uniref:Uncharacterized protein n=1 Tax=Nepenthes gracilis TaxID=150966 RepID=A0AAD3XNI2_NEPGR|nr:hypothetical protein Nepgr_013268 [Nepenthes gracilis]
MIASILTLPMKGASSHLELIAEADLQLSKEPNHIALIFLYRQEVILQHICLRRS